MQSPKFKSPTSLAIGPCRLSYAHLIAPKAPATGGEPVYSCVVMIPKSTEGKETIDAIKKAIANAKEKGRAGVYKGDVPNIERNPALRDGDERDGDEFKGHYYFNCKSRRRPLVIDRQKCPITDENDAYSGMWAFVSVDFFPYNTSGNKGVGVGLNAVMKYKDGDRFGGSASASDFDGFDNEDDDDL